MGGITIQASIEARRGQTSVSVDGFIRRVWAVRCGRESRAVSRLVNSGGAHADGKAHEVNLLDWDHVLDINFRAIYHLSQHTLKAIIKQPGGAIVNIGSITVPYSGGGMQMGAKRALSGYSEALFEDVREYGVKVCTINPGYVNTPMVKSDRMDRMRMIQPEDVARTVMFVLTMSEATCPTEIVLRPQRSPYK